MGNSQRQSYLVPRKEQFWKLTANLSPLQDRMLENGMESCPNYQLLQPPKLIARFARPLVWPGSHSATLRAESRTNCLPCVGFELPWTQRRAASAGNKVKLLRGLISSTAEVCCDPKSALCHTKSSKPRRRGRRLAHCARRGAALLPWGQLARGAHSTCLETRVHLEKL